MRLPRRCLGSSSDDFANCYTFPTAHLDTKVHFDPSRYMGSEWQAFEKFRALAVVGQLEIGCSLAYSTLRNTLAASA